MAYNTLCLTMVAACMALTAPSSVAFQERDRNAALDYWSLIEMRHGELYGAMFDDRLLAILDEMQPKPESGAEPINEPAELAEGGTYGELLERHSLFLDNIERASSVEACDFQIRYEDGFDMMLPHLGGIRPLVRLLVVDARRLALSGHEERAARRLVAALAIARHLVGDRHLISSMVAISAFETTVLECHWLLDRVDDTAEVRELIATGLSGFVIGDTFGIVPAILTEVNSTRLIAKRYKGPNAAVEYGLAGMSETADEEDRALRGEYWRLFVGDRFEEEVDLAVTAFDELLAAWKSDNPTEALKVFRERIRDGEYGDVAPTVMPWYQNVYRVDSRARNELQRIRERVLSDG
ncbi:MAG: hypothetical protein ACFCBV_06535 [Phycisphaerales bacterium]